MGAGSLLPKNRAIKVDKLIDRKIGMEAIASAFDDLKILGKVKGKILMEGNMSKKFLLAVDLGTSACKITVFDFDGRVMGSWTENTKPIIPILVMQNRILRSGGRLQAWNKRVWRKIE